MPVLFTGKELKMNLRFIVNSILLGTGLAMDAFSVSVADALGENNMSTRKRCLIAGIFAFFQFAMPMAGWFAVKTAVGYFEAFQKYIPVTALILLVFIGGKMLIEGLRNTGGEDSAEIIGLMTLLVQGIATSIDALSVGFTIAGDPARMAFISSLIIAAVTFVICMTGLLIGNAVGKHLAGKAQILGGVILIAIGLEIFLK